MTRFCAPLAIALAGLVLVACGPSIDPAAKADIDRRIAAMVPSGQVFPLPTGLDPKPMAVGQWTQHKMVGEKGQPSLVTYKIVGEDAGAYWIEIADESYYGKTVTKILLAVGDRRSPATMEIRAVKRKDPKGQVTELQGPMIQSMKSVFQTSINMLVVAWPRLRELARSKQEAIQGRLI